MERIKIGDQLEAIVEPLADSAWYGRLRLMSPLISDPGHSATSHLAAHVGELWIMYLRCVDGYNPHWRIVIGLSSSIDVNEDGCITGFMHARHFQLVTPLDLKVLVAHGLSASGKVAEPLVVSLYRPQVSPDFTIGDIHNII